MTEQVAAVLDPSGLLLAAIQEPDEPDLGMTEWDNPVMDPATVAAAQKVLTEMAGESHRWANEARLLKLAAERVGRLL